MSAASPLKRIAAADLPTASKGVIKLLLADHDLMRTLMQQVKSQRATPAQQAKAFRELKHTVQSHVKAEEQTFLALLKDIPKFEDHVLEGYEEHRVHEAVIACVPQAKTKEQQIERMKIFCEILEHHLDEEEEKLFPAFKAYAAASTHKKIGKKFLTVRKRTNRTATLRGAARLT